LSLKKNKFSIKIKKRTETYNERVNFLFIKRVWIITTSHHRRQKPKVREASKRKQNNETMNREGDRKREKGFVCFLRNHTLETKITKPSQTNKKKKKKKKF